jgi:ABC-type transport system involved in cytochrome c biogenesis permease subunit
VFLIVAVFLIVDWRSEAEIFRLVTARVPAVALRVAALTLEAR